MFTPLMASRIFFGITELDYPNASDGNGYYYRYARYRETCYRGGNNNSA